MSAVWRAPGRVNLIGEHTDYNEGWVLPIALPLGVTASVSPRSDGLLQATSTTEDGPVSATLDSLEPGTATGWADYVFGVVWALRSRGFEIPGAAISVNGDLPYGAGLSSSAALECAVATALNDAFGLGIDDLVPVARAAENDYVGVPSGSLDQSASLLCTEGHALLLDCRTGERTQIRLALEESGLALLVIDTRAPHRLVDGEYAARRADCAAACSELGLDALRDVTDLHAALAELSDPRLRRRVRHVVTENERVLATVRLLRSGQGLDAAGFGALLSASHASLRDDYEVSSPELGLAASAAEQAGAYGARMTGGGFGGSAIALVDTSAAEQVTTAVQSAFEQHGFTRPDVFAAQPSQGAHRIPSA